MDMPDIPDFLKVENRSRIKIETQLPRHRRKREKKHDWRLPRHMDATSWAILKEQERAREIKKRKRLAALRALRERRS